MRNFLIAAGALTAAVYGVRYVQQYSQRERRKALLTHVRCGDDHAVTAYHAICLMHSTVMACSIGRNCWSALIS